jgi:hypothetical protein
VIASAANGTAVAKGSTCNGHIEVGSMCSVTVTYDPTNLTAPAGPASDTLRIGLTSNAGAAEDFIQNYTVILPNR